MPERDNETVLDTALVNAFIERHYALCLAVCLPIAAALGVVLALGLWDIVMV